MSDLTLCNHCLLKRIQSTARRQGRKIYRVSNPKTGGYDIYSVPKWMTKKKFNALEYERKEKYFRVWLKELTDYCCC